MTFQHFNKELFSTYYFKIPLLFYVFCGKVHFRAHKNNTMHIKSSTGHCEKKYLQKTVDSLWNFLCIAGGYSKIPQMRGIYPLLHPQFVHMIKVIDSKCLGVL